MPVYCLRRISLFVEDIGSGGIPALRPHELGGSSESRREVIPLLAVDHCVIAVDVRCAGRSEKLPDGFTLPDIIEDLDTLLRALTPNGAVDVIGAALG